MDSNNNVFYYSQMKPNEIHTKADQYLKGMRGEAAVSPNPNQAMFVSNNPLERPQPAPEPMQFFREQPQFQPPPPPPPQQQSFQQFLQSSSQVRMEMTPRISYKVFAIEQRQLIFKDVPVKVAEIVTPANFFLVIQERKDEYDAMKRELKNFYESNSYPLPINEDFFYATKMEGTQDWGRVKITGSTGNYYCCLFIDEGVTAYYPENKLFLLDDNFKILPPRCFKAGLLGLSCAIWPYAITNTFKTMVLEKEMKAFVQGCDNDIYKCILTNGINVNETLNKQMTDATTAEENKTNETKQ